MTPIDNPFAGFPDDQLEDAWRALHHLGARQLELENDPDRHTRIGGVLIAAAFAIYDERQRRKREWDDLSERLRDDGGNTGSFLPDAS